MNPNYRYEIKFVLDNAKLSSCLQWLFNETTANRVFDNRKVNSIYFDDLGYSSVKDNLAGISNRNKFRLRWYGNSDSSIPLFEVKTKNGRLGCKTAYPIQSLQKKLLNTNFEKVASECIKEMENQNIVFDEHLVPTLQVNYAREYYETHNGIRITIDQEISFSDTQLYTKLNENNEYSYPLKIMEIKFDPSMQKLVSELIRPLNISPKRHSKYLVGLSMLGYATYI